MKYLRYPTKINNKYFARMRRISTNQKTHSRQLRKNMTDVERLLWLKIRSRQLLGYRFRRQHPIKNYIVDFVCLDSKLIIELDGGQHIDQHDYDERRDKVLNQEGFEVLRFWNNEIIENLDGVLEVVCEHLPPSQPSPSNGEGAKD